MVAVVEIAGRKCEFVVDLLVRDDHKIRCLVMDQINNDPVLRVFAKVQMLRFIKRTPVLASLYISFREQGLDLECIYIDSIKVLDFKKG